MWEQTTDPSVLLHSCFTSLKYTASVKRLHLPTSKVIRSGHQWGKCKCLIMTRYNNFNRGLVEVHIHRERHVRPPAFINNITLPKSEILDSSIKYGSWQGIPEIHSIIFVPPLISSPFFTSSTAPASAPLCS